MKEHKIVNGKKVPLTKADIAQREADRLEYEALQEELATTKYRLDRATAYPSIGDQLDAILKTLNYLQMSGKLDMNKELDAVLGEWLAVKRKYPKPTDTK